MRRLLTSSIPLVLLFVLVGARAPPANRPVDLPDPKLYTAMRKMGLESFTSVFDWLDKDEKPAKWNKPKEVSKDFGLCRGCKFCKFCDTAYMSCHTNNCLACEADVDCATKCHSKVCMPKHNECMKRLCSKENPRFRTRSLHRVEPESSEEAVLLTPTPEPENEDETQDIFDAISGKLI